MSSVPKTWGHTAPLPSIDDTGELPYLPVVCREQPITPPASVDAGLVWSLLYVGQATVWMIVGAVLAVWL